MPKRQTHSWIQGLESRLLYARALGVDVSSYQPTINWTQVKSSGYVFAWTKATEGLTLNDSTYTSHINGAKAAGVLIGAYHYARYDNNSAASEVSHFLSVAGNQIKAGFLKPMLDVENPVSAGDAVNTKAEISQWVNDWCNGVYSATGVKPIVYTYVSYASTYLDSTVTQWPLWMAQYPGSPNPQTGAPSGTSPWGSSAWQIWQYSSTTPVLGIGGTGVSNQCDVDVYKSDSASFVNAMVIAGPVASVTQGSTTITDGQSTAVSFGSPNVGATAPSLTFTIKNSGDSSLTLSGLSVPSGYSITTNLTSPLASGASESFVVRMDTATAGTYSGNISFTTNDPARNPFNFPVTGTVAGQAPPAAPTNLAVNSYTSNSVSLSWTDASNNETGFIIERRAGFTGSYTQIATTAANTTSFVDTGTTGPSSNTSYFYHVRAAIDTTLSNQSNDVFLTTLAAAPLNVIASDGAYQNHITINWAAVSGVTTYAVYRSSLNDPSTALSIGTSNTNSFDDTSGSPNTTYYYWVASYNSSNIAGDKSAGDAGSSDTIAPGITASAFQPDAAAPYVEFTFSEPVTGLDATSVTLTNLDTPGGIVPAVASAQWIAASNTERFVFSTFPDGNFRATVTAGHDSAGNSLTGGAGQDLFFLAGDANSDRMVNALDFNALATHFGDSNAGLDGGDFNFDGTVDTQDFTALSAHFAQSLPAPTVGASVARSVAGASTASLFSDQPVKSNPLSTLLDS